MLHALSIPHVNRSRQRRIILSRETKFIQRITWRTCTAAYSYPHNSILCLYPVRCSLCCESRYTRIQNFISTNIYVCEAYNANARPTDKLIMNPTTLYTFIWMILHRHWFYQTSSHHNHTPTTYTYSALKTRIDELTRLSSLWSLLWRRRRRPERSSKDRTWQQRNKLSAMHRLNEIINMMLLHMSILSRFQIQFKFARNNDTNTTRTIIISWFNIYSCQVNATQAENVRCAQPSRRTSIP